MMLSSRGIGLITVIAVSGCSVMLLVLGRQKLLELKRDCSCPQDKVNQEGTLGSHSGVHHQQQQHAEGGTSISWRMGGSQSYPDKKQNLVKKVRFSENVVEPSGDNVAYRKRHALAFRSGSEDPKSPTILGVKIKGSIIQRETCKPAQSLGKYPG